MENARTDIARPAMLDYKTLIDAESMYNTPPCYTIYMMGLVLKWIETEVGGLANMEARNNAKAKLLYDCLLYTSKVCRNANSNNKYQYNGKDNTFTPFGMLPR